MNVTALYPEAFDQNAMFHIIVMISLAFLYAAAQGGSESKLALLSPEEARYVIMNMDAQVAIDEVVETGRWSELQAPQIGEVVKVKAGFLSVDETQVALVPGAVGVIEEIDKDGDAIVRFPSMIAFQNRARWVLKKNFKDMLRCESS